MIKAAHGKGDKAVGGQAHDAGPDYRCNPAHLTNPFQMMSTRMFKQTLTLETQRDMPLYLTRGGL